MREGHRVLLSDKEISLVGTGFRTDSAGGKMRRFGFGSPGRVPFGTSFSDNDKSWAGFEELAMPLFDSLYNFARWLAHNETDAEDLVQDTYLRALRGFASFQPGTNFRAWMFKILKNTFLSSCSKLERRKTVAMDSDDEGKPELPVDSDTPETILLNRANSQLVQKAIDDLPVHYRETLLLCEVEEMSYREIAEILSVPIGTVMSRLARARRAIRESLGCGAQIEDCLESRPVARVARGGFAFQVDAG